MFVHACDIMQRPAHVRKKYIKPSASFYSALEYHIKTTTCTIMRKDNNEPISDYKYGKLYSIASLAMVRLRT